MRLAALMTSAFERFAQRPALADRRQIPMTNKQIDHLDHRLLDSYETLTYGELERRVRSVVVQLRTPVATTAAVVGVREGDRVALLGHAGIDLTTVDFACNLAGITTVPLQTSGSLAQHSAILEESTPRLLAVSVSLLDRAADLIADHPSLERVIVLDYRGGQAEHRQAVDDLTRTRRIVPETLDLDAIGADDVASAQRSEDHLAMLLYTSGSTGAPKGAMYTDRLVAEMWGGEGWSAFFAGEVDIASFHYMPMSHVAGHSSVRSTLARGGVTYFASTTNLSSFFDDLSLARPTELSLVPRVCELLHQEYQRRLHGSSPSDDLDEVGVLGEMRERLLGGRVRWASCTSAPVSAELKSFMESLLRIELHELYGTTEIGGVLADARFLRPPVIDYRLDDVPELGYFTSDRPDARGELLIKSTSTVPGYFNRPDLDREIFTVDGYYRTGDIAAVDADGNIRIIDRKNAIIKLAQGEFVALPSLEATYVAGSPAIHQAFLYGRSDQSSTLAVIVPSEATRAEAGAEGGPTIRARMLQELRRVAAEARLNSYEIPSAVLIEHEPFSESNGLLSDHRKPIRPRLTEKYEARLSGLYEDLRSGRDELLEWLYAHGAEGDTVTTVRRAVAVSLQADPDDIDETSRFRSLGGDSLTAVHLARVLEQVFGVRVSVDMVVSDSYSLRELADHIDVKRASDQRSVSFDEIHGAEAGRLRATDLTAPRFASSSESSLAVSVSPQPRSILVTGASGYLGRFLCLDLLHRFADTGSRVVCLVRARDDASARERLRGAFSTSTDLLAEFDSVATHLDVIAGDLAEPRLGLDEAGWGRLVREVGDIVHAGAMVNHALPYRELFAANVNGTAEIIRLATTGALKPVTFMSSIATALLRGRSSPLDEFVDIREELPEVRSTEGIVDGYATSKWAGEVLLRDAHERYGLPVTVFRSSMILAHSQHGGQINVTDTFTRLLFSVTRTGLVPASFYRHDGGRAHYDGLPVDSVASAVTTLVQRRASRGYTTYHLVNPFDDGISLDRMVDWLMDAGVPLTRVDSYDDWMQRFRSALSALDEDDRRASLVPLLEGLREPDEPAFGSLIASPRLSRALREAGAGELVAPLTFEFLMKCLRDVEQVLDQSILPTTLPTTLAAS